MNSMSVWRPGVIHYGCQHYAHDRLTNKQKIIDQINLDAADSGIPTDQLRVHKIMIDFTGEGQCERTAHLLVATCQEYFRDVLAIFAAVVDITKLSYQAISLPVSMINHCDWYRNLKQVSHGYDVDKKFLCLMRRPSKSRAIIAKNLHALDSIRLSFGSMHEPGPLDEFEHILPHTTLPILIDGLIQKDREHDQRSPLFHSCAFNLVVESGSQIDHYTWQSIFITEKTYKAFALKQIPIWFAIPGTVEQIRRLGFDLFDDIVDHSYDQVLDERTRFQRIFDQIRDIDTRLDLQSCARLRRDLHERLEANRALIDTLSSAVEEQLRTRIERFSAHA